MASRDKARWSAADLRRPAPLLGAIVGFLVGVAVAMVAGCNVHEVGHVMVAVPLGWEVDRLHLCLPGGGGVEYGHIGTWAGNAQGYAGGVAAAAFILAVYVAAFARPRVPLRGPGRWAAGLGAVVPAGPQLVIGALEGAAGPGEDYTQRFSELPVLALLVVSMVAAPAAYLWRWRAVWTRTTS